MGFLDIFKKQPMTNTRVGMWKELGGYQATFNSFGTEAYRSEIVRSCIRPLARFTSKANARSSNKDIEHILEERPNMYMNGKEFLQKVRTMYELRNNCFIYIQRDDRNKVVGFYPVPYSWFEALDYNGRLFIKFHYKTGDTTVIPWADLAVIRKDYNEKDICGDNNTAIINTLDMIYTTNQGLSNAIKSTANLRGILKSTKAMLSSEDIKKQKQQFIDDYLNLENQGGIASLDATQEFHAITMNPQLASYEQMKELRENVYRYFGVNDDVVMGNLSSDDIEAFYELNVEPFLIDLSNELTSKVFTDRERAFGAWIVFESNKLQFASLSKKIQLFSSVVLYGGMTVNEWRVGCNMAPIDGGDELIRRLDAAPVSEEQTDEQNKE